MDKLSKFIDFEIVNLAGKNKFVQKKKLWFNGLGIGNKIKEHKSELYRIYKAMEQLVKQIQ